MNTTKTNSRLILMADDDPDDFHLTRDALEEAGSDKNFRLVSDGSELMDYLLGQGGYQDRRKNPLPDLILLDLNMPVMDGRQALTAIRARQDTRNIPVVVLTTSGTNEDVEHCYRLGANSYIRKPSDFDSLVSAMRHLLHYWFETVELPRKCGA